MSYNIYSMTEVSFQGREGIEIDGKYHPISFGEEFRPNSQYNIALYSFTDEKGQESDGCVFEISPRGSTRVMRIIDENLTCDRIAIKGSGHFLGVSPDGEVVDYELNSESDENPLIEISKGWTECCIAGDDGIEFADVSTPKFDPKMEVEVPFEDSSLPVEFWKKYKELKQLK